MVETSTRVEGHVFTHNVGWVPEHLKHPLKMVDQYRSPVSDRGQMARGWWHHYSLHTHLCSGYVGS